MEFNQNSELIQVIRKIVEYLLRTKQTKLKKFLFTKDKKGRQKLIKKSVHNFYRTNCQEINIVKRFK